MANVRPSVSLFQGASNTTISRSTFIITHWEQDGARAWDLLTKNCCFEAGLDSNERFDPPKCDPATRVAVIQNTMDWITSDDNGALLRVMYGSAGAGKSALEQSIAKRCQEENRLASSFFLSRTAPTARRSDGNAVVPTTVYGLTDVFPWFKPALVEEMKGDPAVFTRSRAALMDRLFIKHFGDDNEVFWRDGTQPRLIAIDGLDECNDKAVQCDLLRIIAAAIPRLRYPFRFFIACRPESHLMAIIHNDPFFQTDRVSRLDLGDALDIDADIRIFLTNQFQIIRETHPVGQHLPASWPSACDISTLVTKSSGQFIYADTVIRFLGARNARPDDRLQTILTLCPPEDNARPFSQLDVLYSYIFSCVERFNLVWRILGVVRLVTQKDIIGDGTKNVHSTPAFLEEVLMLRRGDIDLALDQLVSIVKISSRGAPIKVLHASLFDFLLDPSRAGIYALDLSLAHETLVGWLEKEIDFNSTDLEWRPIFYCLHHGRSACLSQPVLDTIEQVTLFVIRLLKRHAPWRMHWASIIQYDGLLRSMSILFGREDILPGSISLNFICSLAEQLHGLPLDGVHYHVGHVLKGKANGLQCSESNVWGLNIFRCFSTLTGWATDLRHSAACQRTRPQYLGLKALPAIQELVNGSAGLADDVQTTLVAVRLIFWTQNIDIYASTLPFPIVARYWVLEALKVLTDISVPVASDAAVLLFIASLLPHSAGLRKDEFLRLPNHLGALGARFPKTMEYYQQEATAYRST